MNLTLPKKKHVGEKVDLQLVLPSSEGFLALPVEAEAVQTLLAWLVNRVESGAGVLLLSAI